ncbi:hypothetical protein ACMHYO_14355 [Allopusillimonas ginsengisoli]|uniref:hypothetical protein n=1 Tax=Allopusillimonas ginsengisoli TaxID=453575 RepID=UPI0039C15E75
MKIKLLVTAALALMSAAVTAREIDASSHPDKSFFLGYDKSYENGCYVLVRSSFRGKYTIDASDKCKDLTDEQIYNDMLESMKEVKTKSKAPNFARYADEETEKGRLSDNSPYAKSQASYVIPSPGYPIQFCVDSDMAVYFFSDIPSAYGNVGWNIAYKDVGRTGKFEKMGFWQVSMQDEIILTLGGKSTVIPPKGTYPCGYARRR